MAAHNELGTWGEEQAAHYLERKGFLMVERDWKSGHRDIDLIAVDGDTVVFVEVKTRRNRVFGEPEDAVNYLKLQDVVSVIGSPQGEEPEINHFEDIPLY